MEEEELKEENNFSGLTKTVFGYVDTRLDLLKLTAVNKIADSAAGVVSRLVAFSMISIAVVLLSIGAAIYLGKVYGELYVGFFIVAGVLIVAGILFYLLRKVMIKAPVSSIIIKKALK